MIHPQWKTTAFPEGDAASLAESPTGDLLDNFRVWKTFYRALRLNYSRETRGAYLNMMYDIFN